jgi:hypothetical protein
MAATLVRLSGVATVAHQDYVLRIVFTSFINVGAVDHESLTAEAGRSRSGIGEP